MINEQIIDNVINKILHEAVISRFGQNLKNQKSNSGNIKIENVFKREKDGKEYAVVKLTNIRDNTKKEICTNINNASNGVFNAVPAQESGKIFLYCDVANKNNVPDVLESIEDSILSMNAYREKVDAIKTFCSQLYDAVDSVVTNADIENQNKLAYQNWENMLQQLKDPAVKARLRRYFIKQMNVGNAGHVLSLANVQEIYDADPDATFVLEKHTWKEKYNRDVMENAPYVLVTKPTNKRNLSKDDLDMSAINKGFSSFADAKKLTNNSTQVAHKIKLDANGDSDYFQKVKMYDVRYTIPPADPEMDVFTKEIGLLNNLKGEINDAAKKYNDEHNIDLNNNSEEDVKQSEINNMKVMCYALIKYCEKNNIECNTSLYKKGDYSNFVDYVMTLIINNKTHIFNIIRNEDIEKFKDITIIALSNMCGCPYDSKYEKSIEQLNLNNNSNYNNSGRIDTSITQSVYTLIHEIRPRVIDLLKKDDNEDFVIESKGFIKGFFKESYYNQLIREEKLNSFIKNNMVNGKVDVKKFLDFCKQSFPKIDLTDVKI